MTSTLRATSAANPTVDTWNQINARRRVIDEEAKSKSLYRLMDKSMRYIGTVHTHKSFDAEQIQHDTGTGEVVLRGSDWLVNFIRTDVRAEEDLNFIVDPYPHRRNWRWRWPLPGRSGGRGRGWPTGCRGWCWAWPRPPRSCGGSGASTAAFSRIT